jgi:hypothetical protein
MRIKGSNRGLSLHWTSLAEGNANFSIVIVFRYANDLMAGFEHREEAERLQGINQHASAPVTVVLNWAAGLKNRRDVIAGFDGKMGHLSVPSDGVSGIFPEASPPFILAG